MFKSKKSLLIATVIFCAVGVLIALANHTFAATTVISNVNVVSNYSDAVIVEWQTDIPQKMTISYTVSSECISNGSIFCTSTQEKQQFVAHKVMLYGGVGTWVPGNKLFFQFKDESNNKSIIYETIIGDQTVGVFSASVSNIVTKDIMANSFTISWETKIPTTGEIMISSSDRTAGVIIKNDTNLTTNHSLVIDGLASGIDYYIRIEPKITDFSNDIKMAYSDNIKVKTVQSNDTTPHILNLYISEANIGSTFAVVPWQTDVPTDSIVMYGEKNLSINQWAGTDILTTSHSVKLENLKPATTYQYYINAKNVNGVLIKSDTKEFTTKIESSKLSDLVIADIYIYPEIPKYGEGFHANGGVAVVVKNIGSTDATNLDAIILNVQFYDENNNIIDFSGGKYMKESHVIKTGESFHFGFSGVNILPNFNSFKFNYNKIKIKSIVDTSNFLSESNENNNTLTKTITINKELDERENKPKIEEPKDVTIETIRERAKDLFENKFETMRAEIKELRDIIKEQQTQIKYLVSLKKDVKALSEKVESAINNFITYGVDDNTKKLGAGERAAVMSSFKSAFKKLPETEDELSDAIKIANGRWPSMTSEEAEKEAKKQFEKIYKHIADMDNAHDNAAITVMAYGLRQKAENRNLNSEKSGIKTFKNIYGHVPSSTEDWNIMQAITYSGASRGADTDGDLLLDEREIELGTNPKKPDTDGDGYKDGAEVANGFDPLK